MPKTGFTNSMVRDTAPNMARDTAPNMVRDTAPNMVRWFMLLASGMLLMATIVEAQVSTPPPRPSFQSLRFEEIGRAHV